MEFKKQKSGLKLTALTAALALMLFFGNSVTFIHAQDGQTTSGSGGTTNTGTDEGEQTEDENIICQQKMDPFVKEQMAQYDAWLTSNFRNKASTSTLLNDAMAEYKNLRQTLYDELYKYTPHQGALILTEGLEGPECKQIVDDALLKAREMLEKNARSTSAVKKSTILLNQYQQMNDKLGKLTKDFVQMKAYLDTFAAKLPCYINRSCNKG